MHGKRIRCIGLCYLPYFYMHYLRSLSCNVFDPTTNFNSFIVTYFSLSFKTVSFYIWYIKNKSYFSGYGVWIIVSLFHFAETVLEESIKWVFLIERYFLCFWSFSLNGRQEFRISVPFYILSVRCIKMFLSIENLYVYKSLDLALLFF